MSSINIHVSCLVSIDAIYELFMSASHSRRAAIGEEMQAMEKLGQMRRQVGEAGFGFVGKSVFARRVFGGNSSEAHAKMIRTSCQDRPKIHPKSTQDRPRAPQSVPRTPARPPKALLIAPRPPQELPNSALRAPQHAPRATQSCPKSDPSELKSVQERPRSAQK